MAAKPLKGRREASHAGSWYVGNPDRLSAQLDDYLDQVPNAIDGVDLPVPGARVIIAPHAGYRYSGPCAAWAYKSLDLSPATKRVFVLGPSHTYGLAGCALTTYAELETPLGNLTVDQAVLDALRQTNQFADQPRGKDVQEHSIEMHLPYLVKRLQQTFGPEDSSKWPTVVPILVGSNNAAGEKKFGDILLPYLKDPTNAFIVSSDFCHWGGNFDYYAYFTADDKLSFRADHNHDVKTDGPISKSIDRLDGMAIEAVESGSHDKFVENLRQTKNTVCGRHPIGVVMAALEKLRAEEGFEEEGNKGRFKKVKYDRSQDLVDAEGSSVSYVSFYAVL